MQKYELKKYIEEQSVKIMVYSPILIEKERGRRIEQIHKAAASLLKG